MNNFNPDRAEPVDEDAEAEDLFAKIEAKAKSFRGSFISDTFRELGNVAKAERGQLLSAATKEFAATVGEEIDEAATTISKAVCDSCEESRTAHAKAVTQGEAITTSLGRVEKMLRVAAAKLPDAPEAPTAVLGAVQAATDNIRADLHSAHQSCVAADNAMLQAILAAVEASKAQPAPKRPTWNFKIERDDHSRISNVIATAAE